ncbi:MAG: DUF5777 family beta-barrel protein [Candidatus Krumholzibacteriia bacterium]
MNDKPGLARHILLIALGVLLPVGPVLGQDDGRVELEGKVADLFEARCSRAGCHAGPSPQQGMDLGRERFYGATVDEPSVERPELKRVDPGQPEVSYLMMKLKGAPGIVGAQMPLIGDKLTEAELDLVAEWIAGIDEVDESRKLRSESTRAYAFDGWKIVNLPTTRALDARSFFFMISHRFNPRLRDGYDAFFGLDGSGIIFLGLGYAITDELLVTVGRSNSSDDVELQARYLIKRQEAVGKWPVDVSLHTSLNWVSEDPPGVKGRFRDDAVKFTAQVTLARELRRDFGLAVVPGILFNAAETVQGEDPLVTIGLGGRWRFGRNLSLVAEWVPIVSGYVRTSTFGNDIRFDSWGGGLEITTGGHVFQIVLSNTVGLTTDQYLRGGDLDIEVPDVRLGFNISRVLNFF